MRLAAADFETDPFAYGTVVEAFSWGFYDGSGYWDHWGQDAPETFLEHVRSLSEPHIIYFHNGGNFDFYVGKLIRHFGENVHIINGRIVQAWIGEHEFRDSYSILPFPLADFSTHKLKDDEWWKFEREHRLKFKAWILNYQKLDCVDLFTLVSEFRATYGDALTVGQASIAALKALHPFKKAKPAFDAKFRRYYFGGRNQCFRVGLVRGAYSIYDVNNMYGSVMAAVEHPIGIEAELQNKITKRTDFACIIARNYGALPYRTETGGLDFTRSHGEFYATIHEINAGLETGTLRIEKVKHAYAFTHKARFDTFVNQYAEQRANYKKLAADGDMLAKARALFIKYVVNSSYGKLSQDPAGYMDWLIRHENHAFPIGGCEAYQLSKGTMVCEGCKIAGTDCRRQWSIGEIAFDWILWRRASAHANYYNIAAGASITGAARAVLLRGLACAEEPIYCDTDSIICKSLNAEIDGFKLGAWKLESSGNLVAIAGKKLYAVFSGADCVKKASKGVAISANDIRAIASDPNRVIEHKNNAPKFKLDGSALFIKRSIRQTARGVKQFRIPAL